MENNVISKTNILYVKVIKYVALNPITNFLVIDKNCFKEIRKVLFINGHFIDLITGDEIYQINREYNFIVGPIHRNTMYIIGTYKYEVSDDDLEQANYIYNIYLQKQELIQKRKLIPFRQERIY